MGRIFKYELLRRKKTIFILSSIMIGLSLGSLILIWTGNSMFQENGSGIFAFTLWSILTFLALTFIPSIMSLTCSNGHVNELLYKDTNYLMLTIPVKSYEIIGGRILAGFVESLIYTLISFIFFLIFISVEVGTFSMFAENSNSIIESSGLLTDTSFFSVIGMILYNVFILNIGPTLYVIFASISGFLLIGTMFICVKALTRSYIRQKGLGQFIGVLMFIMLYSVVMQVGLELSIKFDLVKYIDFRILNFRDGVYNIESVPIPMYLVTTIFNLLIAGVFFYIATWLFDKKVEL